MRIINFTSYRLWLGGGERLMYNIVTGTKYEGLVYAHEGGIKYTKSRKFKTYKDYEAMAVLVRKHKDDVIITHDPGMMANPVMAEANKLMWYVHGAFAFAIDITEYTKPFVCLSNYVPKHTHPSWHGVAILPVPLGVNPKQFSLPKKVPTTTKLIVGIVGRISSEKIPLFWFDFVRKFNRENGLAKQIEFHIYGKGDEPTEYFKAFAKNVRTIKNVRYKGEVAIDDIQTAYHSFDLLMVPSLTETGSYAIVEAQFCGLRVYALNVDGIPFHATKLSSLCTDYDDMFERLGREVKRDTRAKRAKQRLEAVNSHSLDTWGSKIEKLAEIVDL